MGFLHFLLRDPADPADPILPGAVRRRAAAVTAAAVTAAVEGPNTGRPFTKRRECRRGRLGHIGTVMPNSPDFWRETAVTL